MSDIATPAPAQEAPATPAADPVAAAPAAPGAEVLGQQPAAAPEWMSSLPEELRGDPTLGRYKSIDELARGHVEAHKAAKAKAGIALPDGTDESIAAFVQAVRPENADAYEIAVPEGMPAEFAEGFKGKAHELGLLPFQVKAIADWNNAQIADMLKAGTEASAKDLDTFKAEYQGDFEKDLGKVQSMLTALDVDTSAIAELESKIGTPNIMKMMFNLQSKVGDFDSVVDVAAPTGFSAVSPDQASALLTQKQADPEWRKNALTKGSREATEWKYLTELEAKHRHRQNQSQNRG